MFNRISKMMMKAALAASLVVGSVALTNVFPSALAEVNAVQNLELNECIGNICVGGQIEVIYGNYRGERGTVTGVDAFNSIISVISQRSGQYIYPRFDEVQASQYGNDRCVSNICVNDFVRVVSGYYNGSSGRVVGVDSYAYSLTILANNGYISVSIRDVVEINNYPVPMPRPVPYCPPGTVYDVFRGICIRVAPRPIPYPVPMPRPLPRPIPYPVPMPRPMPRPMPAPRPLPPVMRPAPRPMPMPGNGGGRPMPMPMPGHGGGRGPR